ncbi:Rossmann-like alpha/beta/alpha sandwich fold,Phosphoadenosine phosphosulphate reductase [Cinara cedri]|uniref:FAD synthase n=1 Tax=Cinara cedri TaxID=506608 RepID=A0A5E4NDS9_9HEMI|nr:Rossmann-like alpha/beta/alpha sandwich fold,Phosphoadenosine phosphosulphate reductase [Cinara cedri]
MHYYHQKLYENYKLLNIEEQSNLNLKYMHEKMTIMEKTSDLMLKYVFKRIIYFINDFKDLINKTVTVIKDDISKTNGCGKFECIVYLNSIGIYSNSENIIKQFEQHLISKLPNDILVYPHYTAHPVNFEDIRNFQTHTHLLLGQHIFQAIKVIKESIEKFTLENIFLSFNGGKDCVVVLYLFQAVLEELKLSGSIKAVYFTSDDQFSEEEDYVQSTVKMFNLDLTVIKGELKTGLDHFLKNNPNLCASIIGTRQSDTGSTKLQFFQKTDPGWPILVRIQPLLHWNYDTVWSFLRQFSIPYCCLYDKGYTSLGNKSKSCRNPNLKYIDENTGEEKYWPAFLLKNSNSERENRL